MKKEIVNEFDERLKKTISQNIKRYMGNLSQKELAKETGLPASTISGYIACRSLPIAGNVQILADYFKVKKQDIDPRFSDRFTNTLMLASSDIEKTIKIMNELNADGRSHVLNYAEFIKGSGDYDGQGAEIVDLNEYFETYNIGTVAAGDGFDYADPVHDYKLFMTTDVPVHDFSLNVSGDSMFPTIQDGETVFLVKDYDKIDNNIYAVDIDGETLVKRVVFEDDKITLISDNEDYEEIVVKDYKLESSRILGKVVGWEMPVK